MGCGGSSEVSVGPSSKVLHVVSKSLGTPALEIFNHDRPSVPITFKCSKYKLRGPPEKLCGHNVEERAIFDGNPISQLYQYITNDTWYFYNDGITCEMHVKYVFGPHSTINVLGNTMMSKGNDGLTATLTIHPGETQPFIEGIPNGFSCNFNTSSLSDQYKESLRDAANKNKEDAVKALQNVAGNSEDPDEILKKCIAKRVDYVDLEFMPEDTSIFRSGQDDAIECYPWQRPKEFLSEKWHPYICLFNGVDPCDIDQGSLGDCYFLCSLSSLAEFPDRVFDIFAHPSDNKQLSIEQKVNAFRVTLNKGGWWNTTILDAFLPVQCSALKFAKNRQDPSEMWVSILEKAYAKAHGSYSAIIGGDPMQALQDLTGYPTTRIDEMMKNRDSKIFSTLKKWYQEGAIMTVSTPGHDISAYGVGGDTNNYGTQSKYDRMGLVLGHAYSLLRVVEVKGHHLVQIRNPWGNNVEWTGAWGDKDPRWKSDKEISMACNFKGGDDGVFWMQMDDVMSYFTGGGACFVHPHWFDYRVKGMAKEGMTTVSMELNVTKKTEAFVSVHQQDRRGLRSNDPNKRYSSFIVTICRFENGKQITHKHSTLDTDEPSDSPTFICGRDVSMRYEFDPQYSPYYVIPRIYESDVTKDYVISFISENRVGHGINVKFKNLGAACPIFDNFASFDANNSSCMSTETEYQYNHEVGTPKTAKGDSINTKK